ncbi:MAG: class I SAM-dependent RNA methyltransferase [Proteobacteria bacterium]|nr:class I SAM-dependent RNA methyltransferase [Pseudomonadota bacterium]
MERGKAIRIEKLVAGGFGLGFSDGPVFIPLTAPGDLVLSSSFRRSRGVAFAEIGRILEKGPDRVEPACPWFGQCGGCSWMHLPCPVQQEWKERIALETISRIGKLRGIPFQHFHPSPLPTRCRYRARLHFEGGKAGFFRRGTNSVVQWKSCLLLPEALDQAIGILRGLFRNSPPPHGLDWCEAAMSPLSGDLTFHWSLKGEKTPGHPLFSEMMERLENSLSDQSHSVAGQVLSTRAGRIIAETGGPLTMEVSGCRLLASPGTFFQVNPFVNAMLVERVLETLKKKRAASLLDLYCGNGNFAVPAAFSGMRVEGVEANRRAAADAVKAAPKGCRIHNEDVERFLEKGCGDFDAVLLDPPRTGLPQKTAAILAEGGPETLIYVSCEPATLARDLFILSGGGYLLEEAELFDMFPQTPHAEILAVMGRG